MKLMKSLLLMVLFGAFSQRTFARFESARTFKGYVYRFQGEDYISERPFTTYPSYRIQWRSPKDAKQICRFREPHCDPITLVFIQLKREKNRATLTEAIQQISP